MFRVSVRVVRAVASALTLALAVPVSGAVAVGDQAAPEAVAVAEVASAQADADVLPEPAEEAADVVADVDPEEPAHPAPAADDVADDAAPAEDTQRPEDEHADPAPTAEVTGPRAALLAPLADDDVVTPLAEPELSIAVRVVGDGTGAWDDVTYDPASGQHAGHDAGPDDGVVRVNDTVRYQIQYGSAGSAAQDATFTVRLPRGTMLPGGLPPYCGPGSSLSPETVTVPTPVTAATVDSLPEQVLVCNVGDLEAGTAFETLDVRVLNAVHNGTVLAPLEVSLTADGAAEPVHAPELPEVVATAALRYDISKQAMIPEPGNANHTFNVCNFDASRYCYRATYSLLISAPVDGKGAMPAVGDVTFVDDVSALAFFTNITPEVAAAIDADPEKYGVRVTQGGVLVSQPNARIVAPSQTAENSVRNSGTLLVDQPVPGGPATVTVTNTDWSLLTYPTQARNGTPVPADQAYVVALSLTVDIPAETLRDFGQLFPSGERRLTTRNAYTDLRIEGFDPANGDVLTSADQPLENDVRPGVATMRVLPGSGLSKSFAGVVGDPRNNTNYSTGIGSPQGPPTDQKIRSGEIVVAEGQKVVSLLTVQGSSTEVPADVAMVVCDAWDNTRLHLSDVASTAVPASPTAHAAQNIPAAGRNVWLSGYNNVANPPSNTTRYAVPGDEVPEIRVQYAAGPPAGNGAASECGEDKGTWYDTPAAVPGNDPARLAEGVYTAVNRVRVHLVLPEPVAFRVIPTNTVVAFVSIGMEVASTSNPVGDILPNWAGYKHLADGGASLEDVVAAPGSWTRSSYVASDHTGNFLGDRLRLGRAFVRVNKEIRRGTEGAFQKTTSLPVLAGDTVQYRITPTLNAPMTPARGEDVWVEDCLPRDHEFVEASGLPAGSAFTLSATTPADARRAPCAPGETYLRWILPELLANEPIEPIVLTAEVAQTAASGAYLNTVEVWTEGDPSPAETRRSNAGAQVTERASMQIIKSALTPIVQVNPEGNAVLEPNLWRVRLRNAQPSSAPTLSDPDLIDVLPTARRNGTAFSGTFELVEVRDVSAGATVLYTADPDVVVDPHDPSNGPSGSTAWCDAPGGGALVMGTGSCPSSPAEVTGLRVLRPGPFPVGSEISFDVEMVARGNVGGDVYANQVAARAEGFDFAVGPLVRTERSQGSSLGDYVWWDLNRNGVQDEFNGSAEPAASGVTVRLTGRDDLGNPVLRETVTDAEGRYLFEGLRASDADGYTVTVVPPAGASFTTPDQGDEERDSDVDPATGTATVVLGADVSDLTLDAGLLADGALRVQKLAEGAGAGRLSDGDEVRFSVTCTFEGVTVFEDEDLRLHLADGEAVAVSETIEPLPVFTECVVTELSSAKADEVAGAPVTVTVPWDAQAQEAGVVTATITNYYSAGTVTLHKIVEGDSVAVEAVAGTQFEILVTCQVEEGGARVDRFSRVVSVRGGESVLLEGADGEPVMLPLGTRCFAEEIEDGGADEVRVDHPSFEEGVEVVSGSPEQLQTLSLTVVNRFTLPSGSLRISKLLAGAGVADFGADDTFTFRVVCTYDGEVVHDGEVALEAAGRESVLSEEIGPFLATTECLVTEVEAADADSAAEPVSVVIPWDRRTGTAEDVVVSMTNYYSAGTVQVTKELDGDEEAVAFMSEAVFEVLVTCQVEEDGVRATLYSGTVRIKGGQTKMLVDDAGEPRALPLGARCFGAEVEDGGADEVVLAASDWDSAVLVTAGTPEELQELVIRVVNVFDCDEERCEVGGPGAEDGGVDAPGDDSLATTGAAGLTSLVAAALGALLLGAVLVLRRREQQEG